MLKRQSLLLVFLSLCIFNNSAQTYEFLNQTHATKMDTVFVHPVFSPIEENIARNLTEEFFRDNWEPLPTEVLPDIELFLSHFDLQQARENSIVNNALEEPIDFDELGYNFIKVTDSKAHLQNIGHYTVLSRPIFNEEEDWAICYHYTMSEMEVGNSGKLRIYRKVNGKWVYYWYITVWIS